MIKCLASISKHSLKVINKYRLVICIFMGMHYFQRPLRQLLKFKYPYENILIKKNAIYNSIIIFVRVMASKIFMLEKKWVLLILNAN